MLCLQNPHTHPHMLTNARANCCAPPYPASPRCLQLGVAVSYKELAPGLNLAMTGTVPDPDSGAFARLPAVSACRAQAGAWAAAASNAAGGRRVRQPVPCKHGGGLSCCALQCPSEAAFLSLSLRRPPACLAPAPLPATGKLAADYSIPHLTLKSSVTLTAAPKVDIAGGLLFLWGKKRGGGEGGLCAAPC